MLHARVTSVSCVTLDRFDKFERRNVHEEAARWLTYFVDSSSEYSDMEALSSEEEIRPAVKAGSKRPTQDKKL